MANLTPHARAQLWRLVRLPAVTAAAGALIVPLVQPWLARWPAIGALVALAEIIYHELTKPVEAVTPGSPLPVVPAPRTPPPA